jgi:hypothetical protein
MENLEERLESLRHGVGNMQHGLPGDEDYCTAAEVIDAAIAELRRLRGEVSRSDAEVSALSDAEVSALVRANGRWSTLAGFLYGVVEMNCTGRAMEIAQKKWEESHAANHD